MLVQKGYESDPVAAWSKAQEKVLLELFGLHLHIFTQQHDRKEKLKVPYNEKQVFSGLYVFKLVLPESTNSQNEESKRVLHGLCNPPTGKKVLLQAVQIQLLTLRNDMRDFHRPAPSVQKQSQSVSQSGRLSPR